MADGTEVADSATLGSEVGQMMGDFGPQGAAPDSASTAEETTPVSESEAPAEPDPATEEPAADAQGTETTSGAADGEPTDAPDPFADATPVSYRVDGQERTYDKIRVLGEDGAVIEAADLPDVLNRLGERDHYYVENQRQYREHQHLTDLATWTQPGPDGKEQVFQGPHGIMEAHAAHARADATLSVLDALLADPQAISRLLMLNGEKLEIDPVAIKNLTTEIKLAATTADQRVRGTFAQKMVAQNRPEPAAPDYAAQAPAVIQQAAGDKLGVLTPQDQQFLAQQMKRYVRETTPAERQRLNGQTHIVDADFADVVKDRIAQREDAKKVAGTASKAGKENAARLAAAVHGRKSPPAPAKKPVPPHISRAKERAQNSSDAWDALEGAAARALRATP